MIRIAVFDSSSANRENIKTCISKYTIQNNSDFDVYWFYSEAEPGKVEKYAPLIHIALISLDYANGPEIGKLLYQLNEDCRIVYYSDEMRQLDQLLCVRPRGFYRMDSSEHYLTESLGDIIDELKKSNNYFYYETRRELFILPLRSILYFQSDLKYVNIHLRSGSVERVYTKLSEIEGRLKSDFLRIHKSYIVNTMYIRTIEKSEKLVILQNGESLPVSDANYKQVMSFFAERNTQNGQ